MKKLLSILVICTILLCSCGEKTAPQNYKSDVKVSDLTSKICETVDIPYLTSTGEAWIALNVSMDLSLCTEYDVFINTTDTSDCFGVFKASSEENAEKLFKQAKDHLKSLIDNNMSEYEASQLPKLEKAIAKKCGLYVTFMIFEDDARNAAESQFTDMLKK